jgi:hypothetical protein
VAVTTAIVCFCPKFEPVLRSILKADALIIIDTPELQRKVNGENRRKLVKVQAKIGENR